MISVRCHVAKLYVTRVILYIFATYLCNEGDSARKNEEGEINNTAHSATQKREEHRLLLLSPNVSVSFFLFSFSLSLLSSVLRHHFDRTRSYEGRIVPIVTDSSTDFDSDAWFRILDRA